jgi:hypothetical protein
MKSPSIRFPADPKGKRIALQMIGGIGDSIIVAGASNVCPVTLVVRDAFVPVLNELRNVTAVSPSQFKGTEHEYDSVCNLLGTFTVVRTLRDENYYGLVAQRLGIDVKPPKAKFQTNPQPKTAFLHASASDKNRNWVDNYWATVAVSLNEAGYDVKWLGVAHDFGFSDGRIKKLSDYSSDLLWQFRELATGSLFIGVDSGFLHLAGVLGVKGCGLFFNSRARNVILHYASLQGIEEFRGDQPSRLIGVPCDVSKANAAALLPHRILDPLGVPVVNAVASDFRKNKPEIGIINYSEEIADFLDGFTCVAEERPITLYPGKDGSILIKTPTRENVFRAPLVHLPRAIREITT